MATHGATALRTKPALATQANALLRKNLTYQRKNWCDCVAAACPAARPAREDGVQG
jgi:hypothetical protein